MELKFKVTDETGNIHITSEVRINCDMYEAKLKDGSWCTVEEPSVYTGLKDYDGVEIYELDELIVELINEIVDVSFEGRVEYAEGSFWVVNHELEEAIPLFSESNIIKHRGV